MIVDASRLQRLLEGLAAFGRDPAGGTTRLGFSAADQAARAWVMERMRAAGLEVRVDAAGNIHGRRRGREDSLPAILFGSHIDTVPSGGDFDGALGSLGALEVLCSLSERDMETRHPLEMVVWADEEGVTFGRGLFGSRAATCGPARDELDLVDAQDVSLAEWLGRYGQVPDRLDSAQIRPGDAAAYLELHVEQGGCLDRDGVQVGVVEGIVGIHRYEAVIDGFANHAGTTPMAERQDALYAAARLVQAVREEVVARPGRQVGNVGFVRSVPGAANVIPGRVELPIELRDLETPVIEELVERIRVRAAEIARSCRVGLRIEPRLKEAPAGTDPGLRHLIGQVAERAGLSSTRLPSGAGHDAQSVARHGIPTGMIFVPSRGGISHAPGEWTDWDDCARGVEVLYRTILEIDRR